MAKPRGIRRFLRFSLRSLLLVTLAVAAWLGYEVHQARTVERQAEAIRALGGEVEFEASPWSLLRFFEPQTYGRRIAAARVSSAHVNDAVPVLQVITSLRRVTVECDGACDVNPGWRRLCSTVRWADIVPEAGPRNGNLGFAPDPPIRIDISNERERGDGPLSKVTTALPRFADVLRQAGGSSPDYRPLRLSSGALAEIFDVPDIYSSGNGYFAHTIVLVVDDRYVGARQIWGPDNEIEFSLEDIDHDGDPELAVALSRHVESPGPSPFSVVASADACFAQTLPGDERAWQAIYAIEPQGFRSLLPRDFCRIHAESLTARDLFELMINGEIAPFPYP